MPKRNKYIKKKFPAANVASQKYHAYFNIRCIKLEMKKVQYIYCIYCAYKIKAKIKFLPTFPFTFFPFSCFGSKRVGQLIHIQSNFHELDLNGETKQKG